MALFFSFGQIFSELFTFYFPIVIVNRDISVRPAWLCPLVGFLCFVILVPGILLAQTEVEGEVSGVWDIDGSPYIVVDRLSVGVEDQLLIEEGVEVYVQDTISVYIHGVLNVSGS